MKKYAVLSVLCLLSGTSYVSASSARNTQLAVLVAASASGAAVGYKSADDFCIKSKPGRIGLALGTGFLTGMVTLVVTDRKGYYAPALVGAAAIGKVESQHPNHARSAVVGGIAALSASMLVGQYAVRELALKSFSGISATAAITCATLAGAAAGVNYAAHKTISASRS